MRKITQFLVLISTFMLFANIAHASSFTLKATPVKDKIVVNDVALFNITIQNNLATNEEFTIKKTGYPFWDMFTKPLQNPVTVIVPANGSVTVPLYVAPLHITSVDTYTLEVGVSLERIREEDKVPITVAIISTEPLIGGYIPTVLATASVVPESIDPRDEFVIRIRLNNQNVINYTNLTVKLESNLFKQEEYYYPLGPKEEQTFEIKKKLDPMTPPQKDQLTITVLKDGRVIVTPTEKDFSVAEYVTKEDLKKEESILKTKVGIKIVSNSPDYKGQIKIETSPFRNLFLTTEPRAKTVNENGKYYLTWGIALGSDRSMTIYITENYRPLVVITVLIIVAIVLYFLFRSPLIVRKSIANVGMSEGGISEAKVVVRVKNRSPKTIFNIEVMDNVPHIANVEKELSIGSMQPHAIMQHPKKGIMIKWNIESIEPGDERILSYKMKSRLSILGEFNLPAANARTKIGNKVIITNSNRVTVGG